MAGRVGDTTVSTIGGQSNDVKQGRNRARFVLKWSSWLSHGAWKVVRTWRGEFRKERAARWVQGRRDEGLLSTVSVRMEKPNTVQAGRRQGS